MKKLLPAVMAVLIIISATSCAGNLPDNYVYSVEDMDGKTVAVLTGTASEGYIERYPGDVEIRRYETVKSLAAGLESGEADCALADSGTGRRIARQSGGLTVLEEAYADCDYRLAVSIENKEMLERLNSALRAADGDGKLQWARENHESDEPDVHVPDPDREKVTVGVEPGFYPYAYYDENGALVGIEIDVAYAVCDELGLEPEFLIAQEDMLLYMAESGKCAFAIGRLALDPNSEAVAYTDPYIHSTQVVVVRKG